jgi:glycosyltransferase involved in cell wall biosynthesis
MKEPLVSVIIPTYNRVATIIRAIESVLNQTYRNLELIVVDDNSTDGTKELVEERVSDKRLKYIKLSKNLGGGGARNRGINEAQGDYIAFQDSDDKWLTNKLEKQMQVFQNKPNIDVVFCQMKRILGDYSTVYPKRNPTATTNLLTTFLIENYIGTPTAVVRKNKLVENKGFDESLPRLQDWDLFIRLAKDSNFYMVNDALCHVYMQENSITNKSEALVKALSIFTEKYKDQIALLSHKNRSLVYEKYGSLLINDNNEKDSKFYFKKGLKENQLNIKLRIKYLALLLGGKKYYSLVKKTVSK